ncbi:MAG: phenylacetate-CoA oxygenase/reductase subunit PaaK [Gammaproteobacteria bacterium]|nr:phenylacetate-CoA oxygenase/reductase subunit PaaK [Gammaproteobacteria bacterium]
MLKYHPLIVADVQRETDDAVRVTFRVPPELATQYRYRQGQHLNVKAVVDGTELRRSYSICNGVGESNLDIVVRHVDAGAFSTFANERLRPGDTLQVMTPTGRFNTPLDPAQRRTYLMLAAGSGITPIMSLIRTTLATELHSRVLLFYGNRTRATTIFREALMDLKNLYMDRFSIHFVLSREDTDMPLFNGHIDAAKVGELLAGFCRDRLPDECYVCGPGAMIDDARAALITAGMDPRHVHFERFATNPAVAARARSAPAPATGETASTITVVMDGDRREFRAQAGGPSILDAAHEQGLELPFSCKGGVCSTCRAKVVAGSVRMDVNYALEPWELEAGYVLVCQSHPTSEHVTLDYDQG